MSLDYSLVRPPVALRPSVARTLLHGWELRRGTVYLRLRSGNGRHTPERWVTHFYVSSHSLHLSDSEWRGQESGTASRYSLSPVRPAHCCCFQSFEGYPFPSDFQTSVLLRQRGDCFISNVRSEPGWLSPLGSSASLGFRVAVHNWHCCVVFFLFLTAVWGQRWFFRRACVCQQDDNTRAKLQPFLANGTVSRGYK